MSDQEESRGMKKLNQMLEGYKRGYITEADLDELFPDQKVIKLSVEELRKVKNEVAEHPMFNRVDLERYEKVPSYIWDHEFEVTAKTPTKKRKLELSPKDSGEKVNWSRTATNENSPTTDVFPKKEPTRSKNPEVPILNRDLEDAAIEDALAKMGTKWSRMPQSYPVLKHFTGQQIKARARNIAKFRARNGLDLGTFTKANY